MDFITRVLYVLSSFMTLAFGFNENFQGELICTPTEMIVYITSLQGPFTGSVYTEGSYQDEHCHMYVDNSVKFMFHVPYDDCFTKQEGSMNSNVIIVQRHERILTNEDAAFTVRCDENDMKEGEIVVTETMLMAAHNNDKDGVLSGSSSGYKGRLKQQFNEKTVQTIYNDKDTITYVKTSRNATIALSPSWKDKQGLKY